MNKPLTYKQLHEFLKQNYSKLYFADALTKAIEDRVVYKQNENYFLVTNAQSLPITPHL